jgi:hypothetical protein
MSLRGTADEASWITYMTPLVKIRDTSSNSTPSATVSSGKEKSNPSPAANQEYTFPVPEQTSVEEQTDATLLPDPMIDFPPREDWELGGLDLPPDMFDDGAEMDMSFWNQQL